MRRESQEVRPRSRTVIELDIAGLIIIIIIMMILTILMILMIAMIAMIAMILMKIIMKFMMTSDTGPFFPIYCVFGGGIAHSTSWIII